MARAYRKKPVMVEAVQWTGENHAEMCEFIDPEVFEIKPKEGLIIHTLEGDHHASPGDYIIKGVNGEFYPCKPDIFAKTYEPATITQPNEPVTVTEVCPHCESEITMEWDVKTRGHKAVCPVCGNRLMLCDECQHGEPGHRCDYDSDTDTCRFNLRPPEVEEETE